jgi:hypothetical protein
MAHKLVGKEGYKFATAPRKAVVDSSLLRVGIVAHGRLIFSRVVGRN